VHTLITHSFRAVLVSCSSVLAHRTLAQSVAQPTHLGTPLSFVPQRAPPADRHSAAQWKYSIATGLRARVLLLTILALGRHRRCRAAPSPGGSRGARTPHSHQAQLVRSGHGSVICRLAGICARYFFARPPSMGGRRGRGLQAPENTRVRGKEVANIPAPSLARGHRNLLKWARRHESRCSSGRERYRRTHAIAPRCGKRRALSATRGAEASRAQPGPPPRRHPRAVAGGRCSGAALELARASGQATARHMRARRPRAGLHAPGRCGAGCAARRLGRGPAGGAGPMYSTMQLPRSGFSPAPVTSQCSHGPSEPGPRPSPLRSGASGSIITSVHLPSASSHLTSCTQATVVLSGLPCTMSGRL